MGSGLSSWAKSGQRLFGEVFWRTFCGIANHESNVRPECSTWEQNQEVWRQGWDRGQREGERTCVNECVPQKFTCWTFNSKFMLMVSGGGVFGRWLELNEVMRVGSPLVEHHLNGFVRRQREAWASSLLYLTMWWPLPCYDTARRPSPGADAMFLDFPDSRAMSEIKFSSLIITWSQVFCYSKTKQTKSEPLDSVVPKVKSNLFNTVLFASDNSHISISWSNY
jgi:hypothetical protein